MVVTNVNRPACRVTVIIATYNWANVLPYSIGSVLDQTFTDFELLVIGDGCSDESGKVVEEIEDARVQWHNLPANTGHQSGPNNLGIDLAGGDVAVRLQPEVLPRTTVTFDDSGSMSRNIGCPSPALAPEIYSFRYMSYEGSVYNPPGSQGKFDENKYPDPLQIKGPDGPGFPSYFETHYRGGVEVARDFAEVVWGKGLEFGATSSLTEELRREAEAQLQKLGIASRDGYRQHGIKQAGLVAGSQETFELARRELEREYDRLILAFKKRVDPALREQLGANGWSGQPLERDEWTRTVHRKRR